MCFINFLGIKTFDSHIVKRGVLYMVSTPGTLQSLYPPMYSIHPCNIPRIQVKTPEICKVPGVLWPAIYGNSLIY